MSPPAPEGEPIRFPRARLFLTIVGLLLVLSLFDFSLQWGATAGAPPQVSLAVRISPITLTLLLAAWLPFLLPELRNWIRWVRGQGIEEVGIGNIRWKFAALGLDQVASRYQDQVLEPAAERSAEALAEQLDDAYQEAAALQPGIAVSPAEALDLIDRLGTYYDLVLVSLPRGQQRTRLMGDIAAHMWTLMPYTSEFPAGERLSSAKGGERLSAYKYLEWRPQVESLDALVARAVGVEEVAFGQYNALLALRRLVAERELTAQQAQLVRRQLEWYLALPVASRHRRKLIQTILAQLPPGVPVRAR